MQLYEVPCAPDSVPLIYTVVLARTDQPELTLRRTFVRNATTTSPRTLQQRYVRRNIAVQQKDVGIRLSNRPIGRLMPRGLPLLHSSFWSVGSLETHRM